MRGSPFLEGVDAPAPVGLEPPAGRADAAARRERIPYLDDLKLLLVAVIIGGHGALAYGTWRARGPTRTSRRPGSPT